MNKLYLSGLAVLGGVAIAGLASTPETATAQACTALMPVGASTTEVEKTVSPPGTGITRDNWNTDFVIPDNASYSSYTAVITPINGGQYDIVLNLKYPDDSSDQAYSASGQTLTEGLPFVLNAEPRLVSDPYQVNVQVGGVLAVGNRYTVAAYGCL
jgi:hypothetical protein